MNPKVTVTVLDGIPIGRRAVFTIDGELWMGFPISKTARMHHHAARLTGITLTARRQLTDLITTRPDLYPLVKPVLVTLARAENTPTWCHDRPELPPAKRGNWRKAFREWAAAEGATHATISGCGPTKVLTVGGIVTRIRKHHPQLAPLHVHIDPVGVTVAYPDGRVAARITNPTAERS